MADWNAATIQEFHAKAGKGVGPFGDQLMLLTKVGAPDHPGWYHNLKANPVAKVEVGAKNGTETFEVRAHEAEGEERERIYADRVAVAPGFGEYTRMTSRKIPVLILERTS